MRSTASRTPKDEPLSRVLDLGGRTGTAILVGLGVALAAHGTAAARAALIPLELITWTQTIRASVHEKLLATYDIVLLKPEEKPAPPPEPEPEPQPEEKAPPPAPKEEAKPKEAEPPPPAPAAAQAGQVVTAPDEPVDFTGDGFVQGNAADYAGGVTHALGTSTTAVRSLAARPGGAPGGTGTAPAAPPPPAADKSHPAGLRGSSEWKCPWPAEADMEQIDDAYVTVQVTVGTDGRPMDVKVLSDPGHGFGREARMCAQRETYNVALDVTGAKMVGQTRPFRIHFER